jgi:hypothetical protein
LTCRLGRPAPRADELIWGDHGFLRVRFRNLHRISDECIGRTSHRRNTSPVTRSLASGRSSLRGTSPGLLPAKEACERNGIKLVDFRCSRDAPPRGVLAAKDLFEQIAYPA